MHILSFLWGILSYVGGLYALCFIGGFVAGAGSLIMIRYYRRYALRSDVGEAFKWLSMACEPEALNQDHLGNPHAHEKGARDRVNKLTNRFKRAGFPPPNKCDGSMESLREWFDFVERVRIEIG